MIVSSALPTLWLPSVVPIQASSQCTAAGPVKTTRLTLSQSATVIRIQAPNRLHHSRSSSVVSPLAMPMNNAPAPANMPMMSGAATLANSSPRASGSANGPVANHQMPRPATAPDTSAAAQVIGRQRWGLAKATSSQMPRCPNAPTPTSPAIVTGVASSARDHAQ